MFFPLLTRADYSKPRFNRLWRTQPGVIHGALQPLPVGPRRRLGLSGTELEMKSNLWFCLLGAAVFTC